MHTYEMTDRHAAARDKKRERREAQRLMRGNRSVFTMAEAQRKRDGKSLRDHRLSQ